MEQDYSIKQQEDMEKHFNAYRILISILFSFAAHIAQAQPGDNYFRSNKFMDFKDSRTNLYGFKNEKGKVIVSPMYSNVKFNPDYGTWDVEKDSLFGFYSREGKLILNPAYQI